MNRHKAMSDKKNSPIIRTFSLAQFGIVSLFTIATCFALLRLTQIGNVLNDLTQNALPQITRASSLNNQIKNIAVFTTLLSNSRSNPERQLAKQKIETEFARLNDVIYSDKGRTGFLAKQIVILSIEMEELDALVELRITYETDLVKSLAGFYQDISVLFNTSPASGVYGAAEQGLLTILLLTTQIDQQTRLHKLRQIETSLQQYFDQTNPLVAQTFSAMSAEFDGLRQQLIGENGLINQKIETLRIIGRTRGRDNFVRNLTSDLASGLQYQTQIVNKDTLTAANKATNRVNEYIQITLLMWVFSILFTLAIIYLLYQRIVSRVMSLSHQVENAAQHGNDAINIEGNDEISKLANVFSIYLKRVTEQEKALLDMTLTDPLTGIRNRRAFESKILEEISAARRHQWGLTVMLIDVDFFKAYNDHYGHSEGDVCLRLVANQLNDLASRSTDFCARYGGEEFIFILPNTSTNGAQKKAEEFRLAIQNLNIPHAKSTIHASVTVSIGVATFPFVSSSTWQKQIIIEQADKALYLAKAQGRNCCQYFTAS